MPLLVGVEVHLRSLPLDDVGECAIRIKNLYSTIGVLCDIHIAIRRQTHGPGMAELAIS